MKLKTLGLLAAAVAGMFCATGAEAATLYVSDGTTLQTIPDGGSGFANFTGALGGWQLVITTSFTKPIIGSATAPTLQTTITATRNGGGDLWVTWSDNNFGPYNDGLAISDSLTSTEATVVETYSVFGNSGNVVAAMNAAGALSNQGVLLGSTAGLAGGSGGSVSANGGVSTSGLTTPYALTQFVHLSTANTATIGAGANVAPVPVPAAAWMGLSTLAGMGGLGVIRRRARKA